MTDAEQHRREAIACAGFEPTDVAGLDVEDIEDLAAGRDVDNALKEGRSISDAATMIGHTDAVATDLRNRYLDFRDGLAARDQITLF